MSLANTAESETVRPMSYCLRQASLGELNGRDLDVLVEFTLAMARESEGIDLDAELLRAGITAVLEDAAKGQYWILMHQDQPIGAVLITYEWSDWYNSVYWWLQSVYIQPQHRGGNVFTEMLAKLEAKAAQERVRELRLYVNEANQRAVRAYKKNGFQSGHYQCMIRKVDSEGN